MGGGSSKSMLFPVVEAKHVKKEKEESEDDSDEPAEGEVEKKKKKENHGFRDRKVGKIGSP